MLIPQLRQAHQSPCAAHSLKTLYNFTDMALKAMVFLALALLLPWTAHAAQSPDGEARGGGALQQLLGRRGEGGRGAEDSSTRRDDHTRVSRMDKLPHLTEDEREFMTKQIMHAISEMVNSECMSNRDYQGWVDFGRRSAE